MKFSAQWLREWVSAAPDNETLSAQLTMAGLEVDAMAPVAGAFSGVVVGEVLTVEPHPDADKLRVCRVAAGDDAPLSIVCGAANVHVGMRAPVAKIGAVLPGDFRIKRSKLRGVESFGMLCSASELGLSESSEGLLALAADAPVGEDLRSYLQLDDVTFELGMTPNRGDCLSLAGIAREVALINRVPLSPPAQPPVAAVHEDTLDLMVSAAEDCPRYVGRIIRGIDAQAQTPLWMAERLRRSGLRPLGPAIDITNYVLLELGQPMHAFDLSRLAGGIEVRRARDGESLTLLDGETVTLDADTLVIADEAGPQALAGIMGGAATAVDDATVDVFLESAFFSPHAIAGRARRYGLHTDSSHRFERGVSPALQREAIERATALFLQITGGTPGPVIESAAAELLPQRAAIGLRRTRIGRVLGVSLSDEEVVDILERLGLEVSAQDAGWQAVPPPWRFDLAIEEDLIEELARIYGYDRLPSVRPRADLQMHPLGEGRNMLDGLRRLLVARGYQEAITYSFVSPALQEMIDPRHQPLALANPISTDMAVMRTTLWAGLLQTLGYNLNRQQPRLRLFETGLRFVPDGNGGVNQEAMLAGLIYGTALPEQWGEPARKADFFDLKGDVEALLANAGLLERVRFIPSEHPALHPGQTAALERDGKNVGTLGALHPRVVKALDLPAAALMFEINQDILLNAAVPSFKSMSRFPAVRRDIAIVVEKSVPMDVILSIIRESAPDFLKSLKLFDVYVGKGIDLGSKSLALGLTLQEESRTLTDAEIDAAIELILAALAAQTGAHLRN